MSEAILDQLAADMNNLLTEPVGSRTVKITDLTPRDGQQCKLATRVTTDDLLPLCASIDNCGFYAVEVWGGATFDVCMRYLKEDPWERLRRIKAVMPKTKLQMLLRGQHILAYRPYTDKIVYKFVERAIANGMNVFRIFEATNDFRNIESATKAVKELGGEAHVEVNYTVSPVHTLQKWMEYAEQLMEVGADWLSLKDATGIMTPFDCYRIIKGIKDRAQGKLPVLLHCHDMGGTSSMCHLMAILAGVDMIDTVLSPFSFGSAHPATETMVASLTGHAFRYRHRCESSRRAGADHPADQREIRKVRDRLHRRQRRSVHPQSSRRHDLQHGGAVEGSQAHGFDGRGAQRNARVWKKTWAIRRCSRRPARSSACRRCSMSSPESATRSSAARPAITLRENTAGRREK